MVRAVCPLSFIFRQRADQQNTVRTLLSVPFARHHNGVNSSGRRPLIQRAACSLSAVRRSVQLFFWLGVLVIVFLAVCPAFAQESSDAPSQPSGTEDSAQEHTNTPTEEKQVVASGAPSTRITKEEAWQILQVACREDKTLSRAVAIRALGLIPNDARARKLAEGALVDDNADVRLAAATALGEMNARASIPKLTGALDDSDPTVVLAAAHSLELMHNRSGYQIYYEVLAGDRKTHRGLIASQKARLTDPKKIAQLGLREGMGFVPYGGLGWGAMQMMAKDDSSPVRAAAARALTNDPDPAATTVLTDAVGDKSWLVRAAALEALAKRGNPSALETVKLYVYDEKDAVRYSAAAAVVRLTAIRERAAPNGQKKKKEKSKQACDRTH